MKSLNNYIKSSVAEMQKVVWPTRKQALQLSIVVIIVSLILGLILSSLDFVWRSIIKNLILGIN